MNVIARHADGSRCRSRSIHATYRERLLGRWAAGDCSGYVITRTSIVSAPRRILRRVSMRAVGAERFMPQSSARASAA